MRYCFWNTTAARVFRRCSASLRWWAQTTDSVRESTGQLAGDFKPSSTKVPPSVTPPGHPHFLISMPRSLDVQAQNRNWFPLVAQEVFPQASAWDWV